MVDQDLHAGPDNEQHEDHVREVLQLQPPREAEVDRRGTLCDARILLDEPLNAGKLAKALGDGDQHDQGCGADRPRC